MLVICLLVNDGSGFRSFQDQCLQCSTICFILQYQPTPVIFMDNIEDIILYNVALRNEVVEIIEANNIRYSSVAMKGKVPTELFMEFLTANNPLDKKFAVITQLKYRKMLEFLGITLEVYKSNAPIDSETTTKLATSEQKYQTNDKINVVEDYFKE